MLRINLLEDPASAAKASATAPSATSHTLILLVGVLVVLLCIGVAAAGYLTLQPKIDAALAQEDALRARQNEPKTATVQPPDYAGLVQLETDALALEALQEHQNRANQALNTTLSALSIDGSRRKIIAIHSVRFDGQTIIAEGRARRMDDLTQVLSALQEDEALQDARFTRLQAADAPLSGRARARSLNAIDFSLYAVLHASPLPDEDFE